MNAIWKKMMPLVVLQAMAGCNPEKLVSLRHPDPTLIFWSLTTDIQAATLAVGGQQQLVATPRYSSGDPIPNTPVATFRSSDPTRVSVDEAGILTAHAVTTGLNVIASMTVDGVTNADTTRVIVTAASTQVATIELVTTPTTAGTVIGLGFDQTITFIARDAAGATISGLAVAFESLDPTVAAFFPTRIVPRSLGTARFVATTTSYGVTAADTVVFTIVHPTRATVNITNTATAPVFFNPRSAIVGVGAVVTWNNTTVSTKPEAGDVTFDSGVENVQGGHIPAIARGAPAVSRTFLVAGTYNYTNTLNGATGTIIVRENQ